MKQKQTEPAEIVDEVVIEDYKGKAINLALAEARKQITFISRDSRNEHFKFDYASGDNMLSACRKVLADCGLLLHLREVEHSEVAGRLMQSCQFFMIHIETGEGVGHGFSCPVVGNADDKASFGCNTGIWKYYLRGLLMLPMGDFDEPCAREDDTDAPAFNRSAAIVRVKNLYETQDSAWVESVMKWVDNEVPEKMTDIQLQTICERVK